MDQILDFVSLVLGALLLLLFFSLLGAIALNTSRMVTLLSRMYANQMKELRERHVDFPRASVEQAQGDD